MVTVSAGTEVGKHSQELVCDKSATVARYGHVINSHTLHYAMGVCAGSLNNS